MKHLLIIFALLSINYTSSQEYIELGYDSFLNKIYTQNNYLLGYTAMYDKDANRIDIAIGRDIEFYAKINSSAFKLDFFDLNDRLQFYIVFNKADNIYEAYNNSGKKLFYMTISEEIRIIGQLLSLEKVPLRSVFVPLHYNFKNQHNIVSFFTVFYVQYLIQTNQYQHY